MASGAVKINVAVDYFELSPSSPQVSGGPKRVSFQALRAVERENPINIPKPVKITGMLFMRIPNHEIATPTAINHAGSRGRFSITALYLGRRGS